ncbi:hypothetical protein IPF37_05875 [bacterium]|nr:MAG: hypothetical protein IPF37_05875 [bacterium]
MIKKIVFCFCTIISLQGSLCAVLDFSSDGSQIVFSDANARMRLSNVSSVTGWAQRSIVNTYGNIPASSWTEGYANNVLIGFQGGDTKPATNFVDNNSNAINAISTATLTTLVKQNSNAINAGTGGGNTALTIQNSNSIVVLSTQIGLGNIIVSTSSYALTSDVSLSTNRTLLVTVSSKIDGGGHIISFARNVSSVFTINAGLNVVLTNVILRNFSDTAISLGAGSSITFGDGVVIELDKDETLSRNWIFSGTSYLNGFGNLLNLSFFNISILQPGRLVMQDLFVKNMRANNIRCVGDKASFTIRNAALALSSNYTLSVGGMFFQQEVMFTGTNIFSYETGQTSTIDTQSTLFFDTNSTFSYAPKIRKNRDLIAMTDVTSRFFAHGCTIQSTTTGLRLTKGTLVVDGKVVLQNPNAVSLSQGISFGNGIAANDLTINILGGAKLELTSGVLLYNNSM